MELISVNRAAEKYNLCKEKLAFMIRQGLILGAQERSDEIFLPLNGLIGQIENAEKKMLSYDKVYLEFEKTYKKVPDSVEFTPYRICPVGAHTDHQKGKITGFAIDKGIYIAYAKKQNGIIELKSLQFPKRAQWHVNGTPKDRQKDWADLLRGATIELDKIHPLRFGLCAVITGELPIGGLSSSAAIILTFLAVLCKLNNITLTKEELIDVAQCAENNYMGVACGRLDQSCEVYCKKDKLLYIDFLTDEKKLIEKGNNMKKFKIAIFFSGFERALSESKYNTRVDECKCGAYCLLAFESLEYGKYKDTLLTSVPKEVYLKHKDKLPENFKNRLEHWYNEQERVDKAVMAFSAGDIETFGKICFESGKSSIEKWQTGSEELIALYNIMTETDGIYGGRFSGAGFKGCCIAIIDPEKEQTILREVEKKYLEKYPNLKGKYSAVICETANGVNL